MERSVLHRVWFVRVRTVSSLMASATPYREAPDLGPGFPNLFLVALTWHAST